MKKITCCLFQSTNLLLPQNTQAADFSITQERDRERDDKIMFEKQNLNRNFFLDRNSASDHPPPNPTRLI